MIAVLLATGLASSPAIARPASIPPAPGWQELAVPGVDSPATVVATDGELWVGGEAANGTPALARGDGETWTTITVTPSSTYGREANLFSVMVGPDGQPRALGIATGGQHLNPRFTVWTFDGQALVEQPQTFETFGGPAAGRITAILSTPSGPRILGTWSPDGRVVGTMLWSLHGTEWRRDVTEALLSSPQRQILAQAIDVHRGGVVLVGSISTFGTGDPLSKAAVHWQTTDGAWRFALLDDQGSGRWGALTDVDCTDDGCVAVGGRNLDGAASTVVLCPVARQGDVTACANVPGTTYQPSDGRALLATTGRAALVVDAISGRVHIYTGESWEEAARPPGRPLAIETHGGRVYLIVEHDGVRRLWSTRL